MSHCRGQPRIENAPQIPPRPTEDSPPPRTPLRMARCPERKSSGRIENGHQSPSLPPGQVVLVTRTSPSKQGVTRSPTPLGTLMVPILCSVGPPHARASPFGAVSDFQAPHSEITVASGGGRTAGRGCNHGAPTHIVERKGSSGPTGTRLSLSLSGREQAPRSPHGRHGCGPYFHKSLSRSLSLSLPFSLGR